MDGFRAPLDSGAVPASAEEIRRVNVAYHDRAAEEYDAKWGISHGPRGQAQVLRKLEKALGERPGRFPRALEIGAGTGYFSLNLVGAGVVQEAVATDISQGMLDRLRSTSRELGRPVDTVRCEAAELPFEDDSFDLVFGHAVLHHLPDLDGAFAEFRRVLRPGGTLAFCGEPSHYGDRLSALPKAAAMSIASVWRALVGAPPRNGNGAGPEHDAAAHEEHAMLEWAVDVHSFTPRDLTARARRSGFERVRVSGEELAASWFGWTNRTLESTAEPSGVPVHWHRYAYNGYLALQAVDRALLEPRLPAAIFYNLLLSARAPAQ